MYVQRSAFALSLLPTRSTHSLQHTSAARRARHGGCRPMVRAVLDGPGKPVREARLHGALLSVNKRLVESAVRVVDRLYDGDASPWRRLWLLEVVARVPYFSFLCVNHLAESLGMGGEIVTARLRAHFAEADNEAVHLAIMEELGGSSRWADRFLARHIALVYFWANVFAYIVSPSLAYHFSELVEHHAFLTYDKLLRERELELKCEAPIPLIAHQYYADGEREPRIIESMYDVILAIRDDEAAHAEDLGRYSQESIGKVPWRGQEQ